MILAEIRDYLSSRGCAPLSDLAAHFDADPEALRAMLETLVRKGRVRRLAIEVENRSCGGCCCTCGIVSPEMYEWVAGRTACRADVAPADAVSANPAGRNRCCG